MQDHAGWHRAVRYRADPALARERAAARTTAYVYGNIILFATVIPLTAADLHHHHAALLVLGVAASTYLAHVFADIIGHQVKSGTPLDRPGRRRELRDALPIVSSAWVPALLLFLGGLGWLPERGAVLAAEGYLLLRMALVGLVVERLRSDERVSLRTLLSGLLLAAAAAAIAIVKAILGH